MLLAAEKGGMRCRDRPRPYEGFIDFSVSFRMILCKSQLVRKLLGSYAFILGVVTHRWQGCWK
jgi:hypothetical protein